MNLYEANEAAETRANRMRVPYVVLGKPSFFGGMRYSAIRESSWKILGPQFPDIVCVSTVNPKVTQ